MKKYFTLISIALLMVGAYNFSLAGIEDRFSDIDLEKAPNNRIKIPEISAPSTNPATNNSNGNADAWADAN